MLSGIVSVYIGSRSMTSMHSKVASADKDGDQYRLVVDLVPSEFKAIRTVAIQEGKEKPRPEEARDIEVHARSLG